jgi:hypothetical protein
MKQLLKASIPEIKLAAVEKALQDTFNTTLVESIELLTGGLSSALVYKITVSDQPYVLRVIMQIDAFNDPVRQYACMNLAAEAGVAPHVYYANAEDAISITDFIEAKPLFGHFAPNDLLLELVASFNRFMLLPAFHHSSII